MFLKAEPHSWSGRPAVYVNLARHPIDHLLCRSRLRRGTDFDWETLYGELLAACPDPGTEAGRDRMANWLNDSVARVICELLNYVQAATGADVGEGATFQLVASRDTV